MNALIKATPNEVTMTSLELVEFINSQRKEGEAVLRHADFIAKVPKVIDVEYSEKFRSTYIADNGKENPCYRFPKRESCLMAMSYSYDMQAKVYDRMTAMEQALTMPSYQIQDEIERANRWIAEQQEKRQLVQQLVIAAPKAEYYDKVVKSSAMLIASQISQKFGWSAVKLNRALEGYDVYNLSVKRSRVFQQWFMDAGYGEMSQTSAGYPQPMFTVQGEAWIVAKLVSEGEI